jgi:hypothetical protein
VHGRRRKELSPWWERREPWRVEKPIEDRLHLEG